MKLLDKFNQSFGFTRTESRVVLFLVLTFMLGMGIKIYKSNSASAAVYNYHVSDSVFTERSRNISGVIPTNDDSTDTGSVVGKKIAKKKAGGKPPLHIININTATKDELLALPGIGEAMAERIILYREENGPYKSIDDLTNVKGIGKKKLEKIAPYCTLGK